MALFDGLNLGPHKGRQMNGELQRSLEKKIKRLRHEVESLLQINRRLKTCVEKKRFDSERQVRSYVAIVNVKKQKHMKKLEHYQCPHCNFWHMKTDERVKK